MEEKGINIHVHELWTSCHYDDLFPQSCLLGLSMSCCQTRQPFIHKLVVREAGDEEEEEEDAEEAEEDDEDEDRSISS